MGIVYPLRGIVQVAHRISTSPQRRAAGYVAALTFAATITAAVLVETGSELHAPLTIIALATTAALAERASIRFTTTDEYSISLLPTLFAAVLFGPLEAGIVGAASMLGDPELIAPRDPERMPRLKWATYTNTRFMCGVAMGLAASQTLEFVGSRIWWTHRCDACRSCCRRDARRPLCSTDIEGSRPPDARCISDGDANRSLVCACLRPSDRGSGACLRGGLALDAGAISGSNARGSAPLRPLPRATASCSRPIGGKRDARAGKPSVRGCVDSDA